MMSPSVRKVWIEIARPDQLSLSTSSPSARKVWIEIIPGAIASGWDALVTFRKEGVD